MGYQRDSDGRWHTYYDQTKGSSCGPACVRMVVKMATGKEVGEEEVRREIERVEGGKASTLASAAGAFQAGDHSWGAHGVRGSGGGGIGTWHLDVPLKRLGVEGAHIAMGYARNAFNKTTVRHPGIAACAWNAGWNGSSSSGLHWVVVAGKLKNGKYLIIDPAYGIGEVSADSAILEYNPGRAKATFLNNRTIITTRG